MTDVCLPVASVLRSVSPTMLDDLTDVTWTYGVAGGVFTATFDADLEPATVTAIRDRLLTATTDQEAERAAIRALIDADPSPLAQALARSWLGDE